MSKPRRLPIPSKTSQPKWSWDDAKVAAPDDPIIADLRVRLKAFFAKHHALPGQLPPLDDERKADDPPSA